MQNIKLLKPQVTIPESPVVTDQPIFVLEFWGSYFVVWSPMYLEDFIIDRINNFQNMNGNCTFSTNRANSILNHMNIYSKKYVNRQLT